MGGARGALLGREREREQLDGLLAAARGGAPALVVVSGEAGIGKTRLLQELVQLAEGHGCLALEGRAAEFERELPFGLVADSLDAYLKALDSRAFERLAMDRLGALAAVFPSLRDLDDAVEYPPSATERFRIHRAVRELVERLAARQPVVLVLDDLQWADEASLELIASFARRPPQASVMVAMGLREGQGSPRVLQMIAGVMRVTTIHAIELGPFPREVVETMISANRAVDFDQLYHQSGGNPFYALQLARSPSPAGGASAAVGIGVPTAVARAISAELDALSSPARSFAEAAAVVGDPFEFDLAAATAGRCEDEASEQIDELVSSDLVRATEIPRRFQFRHPLVRAAVYAACSPGARLMCHRRAIDALDGRGAPAAAVASHLEQSSRAGDVAAVATLQRAGEEAADQAPASAARWFTAALRLLPPTAPAIERIPLLTSLASAQSALGRFVEARTALDESIELTSSSDVEARVRLIVACAEIEQLLGHHNESQARLRRAYDELHDPGSSAGVSLLIALAASCLFLADHEGMLVWGQSAVEAAAAETDSALSAAALAAYTMGATFAGRIGLALELHERASRAVDSLSDDELTPRLDALSNLTTAELYLDCLAEACTHGERGLSLARATGQTHLVPTLTPILGMALSMVGHMDRSAEVLDDAIEAARLVNNAQAVAMNLFNRSLSASMVGDLETALMLGAESVELARSVDDGVVSAFAGAIHAEALFEAGEPDIALKVLLESAGGAEIPLLAGSWRATFVELLTRCHVALHEESQARAAAGLARELASELGMGLPGLMADRAEAAVALSEGRADDAARLALSSVMHAEKIGARVHAARSRALAGDALAALGRDDEAIAQLELAAGEFEALGALRYRDQVEARLRQLGRTIHRRSRPGKRDGNDLETLTGRELEVAGLVFDRRTNREIAEELFLSVKTVETHIRNIFNKLGATSRVEVARALARSHPAPTTDR